MINKDLLILSYGHNRLIFAGGINSMLQEYILESVVLTVYLSKINGPGKESDYAVSQNLVIILIIILIIIF